MFLFTHTLELPKATHSPLCGYECELNEGVVTEENSLAFVGGRPRRRVSDWRFPVPRFFYLVLCHPHRLLCHTHRRLPFRPSKVASFDALSLCFISMTAWTQRLRIRFPTVGAPCPKWYSVVELKRGGQRARAVCAAPLLRGRHNLLLLETPRSLQHLATPSDEHVLMQSLI